MSRKRALIVDDSKSARVILSRMLEKFDIEVDMAESAEQSIEYLKENRPDAIFMDHLMPGMDGLEAVRAIKQNPQTATIPIMMYTSQEGELYVGQARALGAMGVLPKQVRPVDVSKVLYELHLLPDRRDTDDPALLPVDIESGAGLVKPARAAVANGAAPPPVDWGRRLEVAVKDQSAELRRFFVASFDSFASRIVSDLRDATPPQTQKPIAEPAPVSVPQAPKLVWPWAVAVSLGVVAAGVFAMLWLQERDEIAKSHAQLAALTAANDELNKSRQDLDETVKDLTSALAASAANNVPVSSASPTSAARAELVPYGELPLDRGRVDTLREVLGKLEAQGFHGLVKIKTSAGAFCLTGNATDGFVPAVAALPFSKCDLVGNPLDDASAAQPRESLAFANLVASIRQRTAGAIAVSIDNTANPRPAVAYPPRSESLTAGEWNKAALANNRVEFLAEPAAAP
jgi:CheY-like chemotaxis protein